MSDESRLSQIEKLLETSAKMIVRHDREIADIREQTKRNSEQIERNSEQIAKLSELFLESVGIIREMQSQVRGIQTENQRILRHLFGED